MKRRLSDGALGALRTPQQERAVLQSSPHVCMTDLQHIRRAKPASPPLSCTPRGWSEISSRCGCNSVVVQAPRRQNAADNQAPGRCWQGRLAQFFDFQILKFLWLFFWRPSWLLILCGFAFRAPPRKFSPISRTFSKTSSTTPEPSERKQRRGIPLL